MRSQYVLAIDPALSTTGVAVLDKNINLVYFDKIITKGSTDFNFRVQQILEALDSIRTKFNLAWIVYEEGYSGVNQKTNLQLATLRGAILGYFSCKNIPVYNMKPTQVRNVLGCKGRASKEDAAQRVCELFQLDSLFSSIGPYSNKQNKNKTSDIYDAIAIGYAFLKHYQPFGV